MKASRKLDALIAEKVMGWSLEEINDMVGHPAFENASPFYSTSLNDAWMVINKIQEKLTESYYPILMMTSPGQWYCGWSRSYPDCADYEGRASSVAEAICLAALEAIGHVNEA